MIPIIILVVIALTAMFADVLAPHNPEVGSLTARFRPPFWQAGGSTNYLLGTDQLGRDVLSRLIFGARVSMVVGFTAVIFAGVVGTTLGILAGYLGGWVDQVIMRITDAWLALPALTFAIFLAAIVGPSMWNIVIILGAGLLDALCAHRARRGAVAEGTRIRPPRHRRGLFEMDDHAAAHPAERGELGDRAGDADARRGDRDRGVAVLPRRRRATAAAGLGLMLSDGKQGLMVGYWWLTIFPGVCIMLMVLSANLLGDWLRVKLDPQLRQL